MKNNLALVKKPVALEAAEVYSATVIAINLNSYTVRLLDDSEIEVTKAESCLVVPMLNDLVLIAGNILDREPFILHILSRMAGVKVVDLGADSTLLASNLKLAASEQISLEAPQIALSGIKASANFSYTSLASNWCEVKAKKMLVTVHRVERLMHTVTEKLVNSFRQIDGVEQTRASKIRTLVSGRWFFKARHATIAAEEEVAIDGKKVHLG